MAKDLFFRSKFFQSIYKNIWKVNDTKFGETRSPNNLLNDPLTNQNIRSEDASPKRFFGTSVRWETNLENGLKMAREHNRPSMIVIHRSWCGACRALKPKFEASKEIASLSPNFVMISLMDDLEPKELKWAPDGGYVPRILFATPRGMVMTEVMNEYGSPEYKYFYSDAESIAASMMKVANVYNNGKPK